jgi:transmembrane sensor
MNLRYTRDVDLDAPVALQASQWWILLNESDATPADHRAFGEWVARSPERVEAFLKVTRLTRVLQSKTAGWPATPVDTLVQEARLEQKIVDIGEGSNAEATASTASRLRGGEELKFASAPNRRRPMVGALRRMRYPVRSPRLTASVLAGVAALIALLGFFSMSPQSYSTAIGEQRSVVLADGSIVTLNTSSHIKVKLEKHRRTVDLLAGEALFQIAHDKERPFDVISAGTVARAVGTKFDVNQRADSTIVTVVEGRVEVGTPAGVGMAGAVGNATLISLSPGESVTVVPHVRPSRALVNIGTATAWTQRRLVFDHRPLGEVAAEFNRYNRQAIQIENPQLRNQEVTGTFEANDPASFMDFLSKLPHVQITLDSAVIKVY